MTQLYLYRDSASYFCNASLAPLRALKVNLIFYPIQQSGNPDIEGINNMLSKDNRPDLIVGVNYLTSRVLLKGPVSREKISYFLNISNFFISTSLHETFGVSIIEAMSCGLPVISTFSGGPESIIINNNNFKNGFLCEMSEENIKQSMIDIYDSNFDRNKIRNKIKENFSYLIYVALINSIIKKI